MTVKQMLYIEVNTPGPADDPYFIMDENGKTEVEHCGQISLKDLEDVAKAGRAFVNWRKGCKRRERK